jgi:mRNA-degrading endonuclease toxin of MazEF toxin-antitoxin module
MRGHLYWCVLPGERKRRPALVVSPDARNRGASTVVVVPATTVRRLGSWHVALRRGEAGLARASVLKCEDPMTIPKELLVRELGSLSPSRMREVVRAIRIALDLD